MFKSSRWRGVAGAGDKGRAKVVFKLVFHATEVAGERKGLMVAMTPAEASRPTARTEKSTAENGGGSCRWPSPVYETVKFSRDTKSGRFLDKIYSVLLYETGSTKPTVIGEASLNMAEYAEAVKPCAVTLKLKGSDGVLLHVTIQRMGGGGGDDELSRKEDCGNGDPAASIMPAKPGRRTLQSQLSSCDDDERTAYEQDGSVANKHAPMKFLSSRDMPPNVDSIRQLQRSNSLDTVSVSDSDVSYKRSTPKEIRATENSFVQDNISLLSSFSLSGSSAPDVSTDGGTSNSGEGALHGPAQDSDDSVEKLRTDMEAAMRKAELSDLELKTLRKQIVRESRRAQELSKEVAVFREERDMLQRRCEELESSKRTVDVENMPVLNVEDPWSLVNEMKQELSHEKNINADLRTQLQKTQESNADLVLAVKELDEMLEQKQKEMPSLCSKEQQPMDENSEHENKLTPIFEVDKRIIELSNEIQMYKKEREEMEMQMEQLALDYEILKQENHDISSRLEQTQLRETLRMQYECSAHLAAISDLETQVENLERELQNQAEEFEAEIAAKINEKLEQEQRAIKAEELLRNARWNNADAAERLQEHLKILISQMSSVFGANEQILSQATREAGELRLRNTQLEERLRKTKEELGSLQAQHKVKVQQLLSLLVARTNASRDATELTELRRLKNEHEGIIRSLESEEEHRKIQRAGLMHHEEDSRTDKNPAESNGISHFAASLLSKSSISRDSGGGTGTSFGATDQPRNPEVLDELISLKERNEAMEEELKELQRRYSEISLRLAEVEGEREQLVMTVRSLKNIVR